MVRSGEEGGKVIISLLSALFALLLMCLFPFYECSRRYPKFLNNLLNFPSLVAVFFHDIIDVVRSIAGSRTSDRKLFITVVTEVALCS